MLLAHAGSSAANPIVPGTAEAVWSVITIAFAVLTLLAFALVIRWAGFSLGSQIGHLKYRSPKRR